MLILDISKIDVEHIKEYYDNLKYIINRDDIQYLMDKGYEINIKSNVHYILLYYLKYGITIKVFGEYVRLDCISEYSVNEIIRLLDGPLKNRNWVHIRYLYNAGFRDEVFKHYIGNISPGVLGYPNDNEIYEYMIRLLNIPYHIDYERYYEIWYRIDPRSVEGYKVSSRKRNIMMLKRLGLKGRDKYMKRPESDPYKYDKKWAKYYIAGYILDDICPYNYIDWEDDIYNSSLCSYILASYFRYFKKHGITTNKRYNMHIGIVEKHSFGNNVLDIIDNISYESILEYYIDTGKYKEYIPLQSDIDSKYSYFISNSLSHEQIQRLVDVGYIKNVSLVGTSVITEDLAKILRNNNISVKPYHCDLLTICIGLEYGIIILDDDMLSLSRYTEFDELYKIIMYPKGLIAIWNALPSALLLHIIYKYAPNILDKITIPDNLSKYYTNNGINRNYSYKGDIEFNFPSY